ncbi:hypothetical protein SAMN02745121_07667 [Nannocystis exedens]|uniref:Uncharacterized protein n=1 Tax=Nannocystis exedens TaxID=54 RepID=A0A1I2H4A3_9BACT|nr:hypothetical protein NAEX_00106 [Nannocystis exedens]SFF23807.1 hypothetical protein SAMN02745121_07667 [Nannocystis exedens]
MSLRPAALLLLALFARGEEPPPAAGDEGASPLTAPTLLAAAPERFVARRDTIDDLAVPKAISRASAARDWHTRRKCRAACPWP